MVQWSRMPSWTLSGLWVWSALCLAGQLASRGKVISAYSEAMVEVVFLGSVWGRESWGSPLCMPISSNPFFNNNVVSALGWQSVMAKRVWNPSRLTLAQMNHEALS